MSHNKTLRLILGDQLNSGHSWFCKTEPHVTYVLMEVRSETDYATHHIQKVAGFFAAMRQFAHQLREAGHTVLYIRLNDSDNLQCLAKNVLKLVADHGYSRFEYLLPDEYRVDEKMKELCGQLSIPTAVCDTEHFYAERDELANFFAGKKTLVMESFYRHMRKKHGVLMAGDKPLTGQWNYDGENRKKLPAGHVPVMPLCFKNDVTDIVADVAAAGVKTIGTIDATDFLWPVNRAQSLELLQFFVRKCLPLFGTYQDAMATGGWSLYHSRISFSMNTKMISPREVIEAAVNEWQQRPDAIAFNQLEGFVRQIIGWREYMRGLYWYSMPGFATSNYFEHTAALPEWYWTGKTKMNCLKRSINESLTHAYAHHIQRLMVTGNFALLAGVHPDEVDAWYLGIYIDALDWVEVTNTRGMSQFADGGLVGTKPYVSSAAYIDKMSNYCGSCYYNKSKKTGDKACPFNSLYWNFFDRHEQKLSGNIRVQMVYNTWRKMQPDHKAELLEQAQHYLKHINEL